ncbi:hypothetical protein [Actinospica robiniae]|uniref:hypothetical protein n=1 Tax=Actinospica robiniae TaxID=304901 RepID=UPI0004026972|nr:hypothetical protein [Actinospica robiniae]
MDVNADWLARVAEHRNLGIGALAELADVPEAEVNAVWNGAAPSPALLRKLAPAVGLHAADLFAIAGLPVPDDLVRLDARASSWIPQLVRSALSLSPRQRELLREFVVALPQEAEVNPVQALKEYEKYPPGLGGVLVRMLHNRNLNWTASAKVLYLVAGTGPLSPATVGGIGRGSVEISPRLLAEFAAVFDVPVGLLASLAAARIAHAALPTPPAAVETARLIWEFRGLTVEQAQQVLAVAQNGL